MTVESLEELVAAFSEWRSKKRHVREATPDALVARARVAAAIYGVGRVARAVNLSKRRLRGISQAADLAHGTRGRPPAYSRVEVMAPSAARPFAEVEMPSGIKLRVFAQTPEALGLLSSVCAAGGAR